MAIFLHVQPVFVPVKVFDKPITAAKNIRLQRREAVASRNGNCFSRATDFGGMKLAVGNGKISRSRSSLFWSYHSSLFSTIKHSNGLFNTKLFYSDIFG